MKRLFLTLLSISAVYAQTNGTANTQTTVAAGSSTIRTVQTKLREFPSVADFGADPTGVANSTPAFQAAVNAIASGASGLIWCDPGTYLLNTSVTTSGNHPLFWLEPGCITTGAGSLSVTAINFGTSLFSVQTPIGMESTTVSSLPGASPAGQILYVSNGTPGSIPCAGSGTGSTAVSTGSGWNCNSSNGTFPAGQQTQVLQLTPNSGNATTTRFASLPTLNASDYAFPAQSPSGSPASGSFSINFAPCPLGVNNGDTGHYLYLTAGSGGTAEAGLITGGTCTSGAASGTIIVTLSHSHGGGWTVTTATGGIQEALCEVAGTGGDVTVPSSASFFLYSNVGACGASYSRVTVQPGAAVSGAFTILGGSFNATSLEQIFQSSPTWSTLNTLWNGTQFDIGGFPTTDQVGFGLNPDVQALVGSVNPPNTVQSTPYQIISGVSGYANSYNSSENSVGLYGQCYGFGAGSSCWGINVEANHVNGIGGGIVGIEADVEEATAAGQGATSAIGVSSVADFVTPLAAGGISYAFAAQSVSNYPFTYAFGSVPGTTSIGLYLGTSAASGISQSQIMQLLGNDGTNNHVGWQFVDSSGNWWLQDNKSGSTGATAIYLDPVGSGAANLTVGTTEVLAAVPIQGMPVLFATLPACASGTEGMRAPVKDSTTNTWGATITGSGADHVLAYCDGTNWTVAAK